MSQFCLPFSVLMCQKSESFMNPTAERGPPDCEVTQEDLFDPMLKDTYVNLPPLR
jgi:hypothetical protein